MLVDADKAREKLAKVCEEFNAENWRGIWREDDWADMAAAAIRQTDLTDCRVETDFEDLLKRVRVRRGTDQKCRLRGEMPNEKWPWIHEGELIDAVESLSAQVAELKKVLSSGHIVCWVKHGPYNNGEQPVCVFIDPEDDIHYSPLFYSPELETLSAQVAELKKALAKYGKHGANCLGDLSGRKECICGFDSAKEGK